MVYNQIMEVINGQWIMDGVDSGDPGCVHTSDELLEVIERVGFMPLFSNSIPGFSVENMTDPVNWWCGDETSDPWEWRIILARTGKVAYGKFFGGKAGFVSKKWFPHCANYGRDGYDFDARYEDGKARHKEKLVMGLFEPDGVEPRDINKSTLTKYGCHEALYTNEMKEMAGFGKDGFKGFEGVLTKLQMQTYLITRDFIPRINKHGEEFGWPVAIMTPPEYLWGYKFVTGQYKEMPGDSLKKITGQISKFYDVTDRDIRKVL